MVMRTHLIAGACLVSTGLVMGTINAATAAADPDGASSSESAQTAGDSGAHGGVGAAGTDDSEPSSSAQEHEDNLDPPRSTVAVPSATSDDTAPADATSLDANESSNTDTDLDPPAHISSGSHSEASDPEPSSAEGLSSLSSSSMSALSLSLSTPHNTPELAPLVADQNVPDAAAIPDAGAITVPAGPAAAIPGPSVSAGAAPLIQEAIAHLVRTLVLVAFDVVDAIIALVADLRAGPGIAWARLDGGRMYPQGAFLPNDAIVGLLTRMLSHASSPGVGSSILGGTIAGISIDRIMSLTSTLPPAEQPITEVRRPDRADAPPAQRVVTALAAMSLWALLSGALPGLGGLLVFGATGVRIGYRQARARMALHAMELVRFARSGPIGIVRTDARIAVNSRTAPADITPRGQHLRLAS